MKKTVNLILAVGLLALWTAPGAAQSYDTSPDYHLVIPECIWAAATGGGTWVSELEITAFYTGTIVSVTYRYGTESQARGVSNIFSSTHDYQTVKFPNILSSLQALDPSFTYYGTVGALLIRSQDASHPILAQVRTVNGNYGKTFPALRYVDGNTANLGRNMMILNLTQNATYRTFVGFWNGINGGHSQTVQFILVDAANGTVGSAFSKTFGPFEYASFNPFVEAGVGSLTVDLCWLYIHPTASDSYGTGTWGLFCFGSSANNITNDSSALLANQFQ